MKSSAFWDVKSCSPFNLNGRFERRQRRASLSFYQTTLSQVLKDSNLDVRRTRTLGSHKLGMFSMLVATLTDDGNTDMSFPGWKGGGGCVPVGLHGRLCGKWGLESNNQFSRSKLSDTKLSCNQTRRFSLMLHCNRLPANSTLLHVMILIMSKSVTI
jgi:hypothetical protein